MSRSGAVPNFKPSVNGLPFANSWPTEPDITVYIDPPVGNIAIGNADNGLCGGMVFTVRDFYQAKLLPPPNTANPPSGSPLFNYIVNRLLASFNIPWGVLKYLEWMITPDHDTGSWIFTRRGLAWRTIVEELPQIMDDIDQGVLSPLGLVTVYSLWPSDLGKNHQVLAYAYQQDDFGNVTLQLYDPNSPLFDGVFLSLNNNNPTHTTPITGNVNIPDPIRGFFRVDYSYSDPSQVGSPPTPTPSTWEFSIGPFVHSATVIGGKGDDTIKAGKLLGGSGCVITAVYLDLVDHNGQVLCTMQKGAPDCEVKFGPFDLLNWGAGIRTDGTGTDSEEVTVHWWFDVGVACRYQLRYQVTGSNCSL